MQKYTPQWFRSPINLPVASSGKIQVRHRIIPAGQEVKIVGSRQAILRGRTPVSGMTQEPLRIHELVEEDQGIWMTDLPEELNQIGELLHNVKPRGRVLVGGLGLGILAETLTLRPSIKQITVVERNQDVIKLCAQRHVFKYQLVYDDIRRFLEVSDEHFDYYLLDTWQGTSESTWFEDVLPLRRAIRRRWGRKPVIHCWAEDIMVGQIHRTLTNTAPHWYYTYMSTPMTPSAARRFVQDAGLPTWEQKYGAALDRYVTERSERRSS